MRPKNIVSCIKDTAASQSVDSELREKANAAIT